MVTQPAPHLPAPPSTGGTASPSVGVLRMTAAEAEMFRDLLVPPPRCYLEWGLGGSTAEALRAGAGLVVSVESDPAWIAAARRDPAIASAEAGGRLRLVHADIGATGAWGMPLAEAPQPGWAGYAEAPWPALGGAWPDLVLVDGRFRVACCLALARECLARPGAPPPRLLLHDAGRRRPHYDAVRLAWAPEARVGSLICFRLRRRIDPAALGETLARHLADPR